MNTGAFQLNDKWDEDKFQENGLHGKVRRNYIKIAKVGIMAGFVVVLWLYSRYSSLELE